MAWALSMLLTPSVAALVTAACSVLVWLVVPGLVAAQPMDAPFTVNGRVIHGTAGSSTPEGLKISLFSFTADAIVGSWETELDSSGSFRFEGIAESPGSALALLVDYQDVTYSARVSRIEGAAVVTQDVTIYDSVGVDPGIRFDQTALIIGQDAGRTAVLSITEIHSIVNPTERSFLPRSDGPGGPSGLLVFGLPPDAFDLTPGLGLDANRIVQIGRGFASFAPVIPGRTEVSFSYRVGYAESALQLERTVRYPVDTVRVIAVKDGPALSSPQLPASEVVTIGERQHQTLAGGPFVPGTALVVTVSGLNVPGGIFAGVPPTVPAAVGTSLGLLAIAVYWVRAQRQPNEEPS